MTPFRARGAEQPIEWRSLEARDPRPTLLYLGASGSHACRALDQSFFDEPPRTVENFRCVRVDAYLRPDVALPFQRALRSELAWPLVAIQSPSGVTLAVEARPSPTVLERLVARDFTQATAWTPPVPLRQADSWRAVGEAFDVHHGGFGGPPKRPRPPLLELLLDERAPAELRPLARKTLDALVTGGIHDPLAGGFHRAADAKWIVPHFEKRLSDQAALLMTFTLAHRQTGEARYHQAAQGILACLAELADGEAGQAGEDADAGAFDDGSFYTFTMSEAQAALDPDAFAVAQPYFDLYGRGEHHADPTRNILFRAAPLDAIARSLALELDEAQRRLARATQQLRAAREARPRPERDRTLYTGDNAHLARALFLVGETARALALVERLYAESLAPSGRVRHVLAVDDALAWPADAAQLGLAALDAHRATGEPRHLERARQLAHQLSTVDLREHVLDGEAASAAALAGELFRSLDDASSLARVLALDGDDALSSAALAHLRLRAKK